MDSFADIRRIFVDDNYDGCATVPRELLGALIDVAEAAEWACDGSGCEFEDERVRYETWQHQVGAMRALREKVAKLEQVMEANRD